MLKSNTRLSIDEFHYRNTYKKLAPTKGGKSSKDTLFKTMAELFVWAAILGYKEGPPIPIKKREKSTTVEWAYIKEPHNYLLTLLAIESTGSFELLNNLDELQKNIEEHSNGGLELMQAELSDPLNYSNLESLILHIQSRLKN
jgi:dnd system-associated protein 4